MTEPATIGEHASLVMALGAAIIMLTAAPFAASYWLAQPFKQHLNPNFPGPPPGPDKRQAYQCRRCGHYEYH